MIPKKLALNVIQGGYRLSGKIMRKQPAKAANSSKPLAL
jgi:hypothetical protein